MEGGCHCKKIRFKVTEKPFWVGNCYCADCRKITGAPYATFAGFLPEHIEFTSGKPKEYRSSEKVVRSFCDNCGASISYDYFDNKTKTFIYAGLFDKAEEIKPQKHIWVSQKLPWVHICDDLPQSE